MIELVAPTLASAGQRAGVSELLSQVDQEFHPPLSNRIDSTSLQELPAHPSLRPYLDSIENEKWLLATKAKSLIGLLSFMTDYRDPHLNRWSPAAYVTTIAVAESHRGCGVARQLYAALRRHAVGNGLAYLVTRTWHTNTSHLKVLQSCGFVEVMRWPRDRPGGLDTVYLASPAKGAGDHPQ